MTERENYLASPAADQPDEILNVDVLARILDKTLPLENRTESEDYGELLDELKALELNTPSKVEKFISEDLERALKRDQDMVEQRIREKNTAGTSQSRLDRGIF